MKKILVIGFGVVAMVAFSQLFYILAAALAQPPEEDWSIGMRALLFGENGGALLVAVGVAGSASAVACAILASQRQRSAEHENSN